MRRTLPIASAVLMFSCAAALAQVPGTRLRGQVEAVNGSTMTIKTMEGTESKVTLAPGYSVGGVVPGKVSDIKKGGYVGVGAKPQPDGTLQAIQVFIFPEAMRGTGEGHKPWGVLPDTTMTNATVADTVSKVDGANLVLNYPGGEQKVTITPEANIITAAPAETSELKAGAQVALTANREADGSYKTSRVTVAKGGAKLPY